MAYSRVIYINNRAFTNEVQDCSFTWDQNGCNDASLKIATAMFDDFRDIKLGSKVDIRYDSDSSTRWWLGMVVEMTTDLDSGLTIKAKGLRTRLSQTVPTGRFGALVPTKDPTDLTAVAETNEDATLPTATYQYRVTAVDEEGETWSATIADGQYGTTGGYEAAYCDITLGEQVNLAWKAAQGATAYRIYRTTTTFAEAVYFETSELTFSDDGNTEGTSRAFPFADSAAATARTPTIEATDVRSVARYIIETYLPTGLEYDADNVTAGADVDLDDYDLTDSSANLQDVLSALADIVGNTHWWVDEDGAVHFTELSEAVDRTYTVQLEGAVSVDETDILKNITRTVTQDSVTTVKVEGEEDFEDEDKGIGNIEWDFDTPLPLLPGSIARSDTADHRVYSVALPPTPPKITSTDRTFLDSYATLADWLADFPNLRWFWSSKDWLSDAQITRFLTGLKNRIDRILTANADPPEGWLRDDVVGSLEARGSIVRHVAGVKTALTAGQAALNWMLRLVPNPESWSIGVERITTIIRPGRGKIRIETPSGDRYDLEVQNVQYFFDEVVTADIAAGTKIYTPEEQEQDEKQVAKRVAHRRVYPNTWAPYRGGSA